jgi:hypothetical protein
MKRRVLWGAVLGLLVFQSAAQAAATKDTVVVTPATPTTKDSIAFRLFNASHCCCTIYRDNAVSTNDTAIFLSYSVDETPCLRCECFTAGSWTDFATAPLKAGIYGIYRSESPYCAPPGPCPPYVLRPVRVGSVIVSGSTAVTARRVVAHTTVPRAEVFDLRGATIHTGNGREAASRGVCVARTSGSCSLILHGHAR